MQPSPPTERLCTVRTSGVRSVGPALVACGLAVMVAAGIGTAMTVDGSGKDGLVRESNPALSATVVDRAVPRTVSVVMGGDLLWHNTVWQSAAEDHARTGRGGEFDFGPMFAQISSLIRRADVAICHEEVPFAAPGAPYENYPVFAAPPEIAAWIGGLRLGRLRDRLQPQPRPGLRRTGAHLRPARPGRSRPGRHLPHQGRSTSASRRHDRPGRASRDRRRDLWHQRDPAARGQGMVGLPVGRTQPAAPGPQGPGGRRGHRGRQPARRVGVRRDPDTRADRTGRAAQPIRRHRPHPRRARPRGPADHQGPRDLGRLRHGQHGCPVRTVPSAAPTKASRCGSSSPSNRPATMW